MELRATQEHVDAALWRAQSLMSARRYEEGREVLDSIRPELETLGPGPARVRGLALDAAAAGYREAFLLALRLGAVHLGRDIALDLAALVGDLQEDYREALSGRIDERDRGPAALRILDMRAIFEMHRGDPEAAFEFAEQALALGEETLGELDDARETYEHALRIIEATSMRRLGSGSKPRSCRSARFAVRPSLSPSSPRRSAPATDYRAPPMASCTTPGPRIRPSPSPWSPCGCSWR